MASRRFASLSELASHFEAVATILPAMEERALFLIGGSVQQRAQQKIGHYQSGWAALAESTLEGWRGYPGKIALGYAPPDNPLLRTGYMQNSISFDVRGRTEVVVGDRDPKAIFHELGTSKMPPRPDIGPAMKENRAQNIALISAAVAEAFRTAP